MTRIQKKLLELLVELDTICRENGIRYSIAESTAVMALKEGHFTEEEYLAEVVMTLDNYRRFLEVCPGSIPEGRAIENALSNRRMDGAYTRYVNTETTLIDYKRGDCFIQNGLHVAIRPIMTYKPSSRMEKARASCVLANSRYLSAEIRYVRKKQKLKLAALMAARCFLSDASAYFRLCMKDGKSKPYYYTGVKEKVVVPRELLGGYTDVEYEGVKLMCFENKDEWLSLISKNKSIKAFGKSKSKYRTAVLGVISDTYVPFRDLISEASRRGLYGRDTVRLYGRYAKFKELVYDPKEKKVDADWKYVRRTKVRFGLWHRYHGSEKEIIDAYEAGRVEEVRELLKPYMDAIVKYAGYKMGISIDRELFSICLELLREEGKGAAADKAVKYLPKEYRESVTEYLEREGFSVAEPMV